MVISKRAYMKIFKSGAKREPAPGAAPSEPPARARAPFAPAARHKRDSPHVRAFAPSPESLEADAEDVIDLGAPRVRRAPPRASPPRSRYVPNPRLYPGPIVQRKRRAAPRSEGGRTRRRKHVLRRPVPNSRLYRPAPARPPPPPARPRASWPPPAPLHPLDTASRVALQVRERRLASATRGEQSPPPPPPLEPAPSRHLVVTLPVAGGGDSPPRAPMDAGRADGNESPSAPSEYLAEFLSAIMRRQYAEALKYCRLILQYEPQNATARGFHPLLVRKVRAAGAVPSGASSCSSGGGSPCSSRASSPRLLSAGSSSSEESVSCSPLLSHARSDTSRSDTDGNGNPLPTTLDSLGDTDADLENDNTMTAGGGDAALGDGRAVHSKGEASGGTSLQRLRAQFACSIK